jgi:hypothetical protein
MERLGLVKGPTRTSEIGRCCDAQESKRIPERLHQLLGDRPTGSECRSTEALFGPPGERTLATALFPRAEKQEPHRADQPEKGAV